MYQIYRKILQIPSSPKIINTHIFMFLMPDTTNLAIGYQQAYGLVSFLPQIQSIQFSCLTFFIINKIDQSKQKMKIMSNLREIIQMGDFFHTNQILRFEKETEFKTFTGGLISICIIVTIIIAFASMILDTVNRTIITYSHIQQKENIPSLSQIIASSDQNFMFGVQVQTYNLSSDYRYFDVVFEQIESSYGKNYVSTQYPLQPCTKQHWAMLQSVVETFQQLHANNWLCPTIGTIIKLQGKFSSQLYNQFSVTLYPCSNATDVNRPCASRQQIDSYVLSNGQWNYFNFYYVNSIINADQPHYKNYYLQDRNYIPFSITLGAQLDMYLTQIQITSDNSIWPFKDSSKDLVFQIPFSPIIYPLPVDNSTCYATFYVMKDSSTQFYVRQVQKIFVVLSFMGGLIGAIMASLFIINAYTNFAYEVALALQVFKDNQQSIDHKQLKKVSQGSVSIHHFIKYCLYQLIKKFKCNVNWPTFDYMKQCREQIIYQLDIKGLIKRVIFLQYAISYMLQDFHISQMQRQRPVLPSQIKKLRQQIDPQIQPKQMQIKSFSSNIPLEGAQETIFEKKRIEEGNNNKIMNGQIHQASDIRIQHFQMAVNGSISKLRNDQNFRKIKESAINGNLISKKLLNVIQGGQERSQSSKSLCKMEYHNLNKE